LSLAIASEAVCCLRNGFYGQEGRKVILVRGRKRKPTSTINRKRGRQTPREREEKEAAKVKERTGFLHLG